MHWPVVCCSASPTLESNPNPNPNHYVIYQTPIWAERAQGDADTLSVTGGCRATMQDMYNDALVDTANFTAQLPFSITAFCLWAQRPQFQEGVPSSAP